MKIDSKEIYDTEGILTVKENEICCYQCINFECFNSCLIHGDVKSVVSKFCDDYYDIEN